MSTTRVAAASVGVIAMSLGLGALVTWRTVTPYAEIGSVYLAQQMCACLYVAGRSETTCRREFAPDITQFQVKIDAKAVEARLLTGYGRSEYDAAYGCRIVR